MAKENKDLYNLWLSALLYILYVNIGKMMHSLTCMGNVQAVTMQFMVYSPHPHIKKQP